MEYSKEYDTSDPDVADGLRRLEEVNEQLAKRLTSWQDIFDDIHTLALRYANDPNPVTASSAVLLMHAFVIAMEQMPEEGDVLAIAMRMQEVMLLRTDLTGMVVMTDRRLRNAMSGLALASILENASGKQDEPASPPTNGHGTLH